MRGETASSRALTLATLLINGDGESSRTTIESLLTGQPAERDLALAIVSVLALNRAVARMEDGGFVEVK